MRIPKTRKELARCITDPLVKLIARRGVSPNTLTVTGFLVSLVAAYLVARGFFLAGGIVVLLAGFIDLLDGALARAVGRVTKFGALLDSTLDRLSEAALLFGLLVFYLGQDSMTEIILIFLAIVGGLLVSYIRARAEGLGIECGVGILTRAERVIILVLGLILNQVLIALWVLAILTYVTVAQRVFRVWQQTKSERR